MWAWRSLGRRSAPAPYEPKEHHDDRHDEQEVDEAGRNVEREKTKHPQDNEQYGEAK
jgi:hypothetical protein